MLWVNINMLSRWQWWEGEHKSKIINNTSMYFIFKLRRLLLSPSSESIQYSNKNVIFVWNFLVFTVLWSPKLLVGLVYYLLVKFVFKSKSSIMCKHISLKNKECYRYCIFVIVVATCTYLNLGLGWYTSSKFKNQSTRNR